MNRSAVFVTFEGIDGAGKSSHIEWFAAQIGALSKRVLVTREPGGTELAEAIREWLLHRSMSMRVETLLAFAARQDHLDRIIRPALAEGVWVICDRFTDSTVAYQGGGRGLPVSEIALLEGWVQGDFQPDRTYLFDIDPAVAAARRQAVRVPDRFEVEQLAFFERVRAAYLARAQAHPARVLKVDGNQSMAAIRAILSADVQTLVAGGYPS